MYIMLRPVMYSIKYKKHHIADKKGHHVGLILMRHPELRRLSESYLEPVWFGLIREVYAAQFCSRIRSKSPKYHVKS